MGAYTVTLFNTILCTLIHTHCSCPYSLRLIWWQLFLLLVPQMATGELNSSSIDSVCVAVPAVMTDPSPKRQEPAEEQDHSFWERGKSTLTFLNAPVHTCKSVCMFQLLGLIYFQIVRYVNGGKLHRLLRMMLVSWNIVVHHENLEKKSVLFYFSGSCICYMSL